jgi:hypothetical protein
MTDLELLLAELGAQLDYPPTPPIAGAVGERLRSGRPRWGHRAARRVLIPSLAALLVVAAAAVAAVPSTRHAVLDWLGLRSARVVHVPKLPTLPPGAIGRRLDLGRRTTLSEARSQVRFHLLVPEQVPDEVYVSPTPPGGRVTLVYEAHLGVAPATGTDVRMLVTEFLGEEPKRFLEKMLGPGTSTMPTRVNGERAVWISGAPHEVVYLDVRGHPRLDTLRLAGNTLLWRHGSVLVRVEAHITLRAALRIARSMR